jgi:nickel-type superoxide dismutase maturation protease
MQVEGYSMWPTLKPKDRVIVRPLDQHAAFPAIGAIVVCLTPHKPSRPVIKP